MNDQNRPQSLAYDIMVKEGLQDSGRPNFKIETDSS